MDYIFLDRIIKKCSMAFANYSIIIKNGNLELVIIGSQNGFAKRILFSSTKREKDNFMKDLHGFLVENLYIKEEK